VGSGRSRLNLRTCVSGRYADRSGLAITGFAGDVQTLDRVHAGLDSACGFDLGLGAPCDRNPPTPTGTWRCRRNRRFLMIPSFSCKTRSWSDYWAQMGPVGSLCRCPDRPRRIHQSRLSRTRPESCLEMGLDRVGRDAPRRGRGRPSAAGSAAPLAIELLEQLVGLVQPPHRFHGPT
jgi:hypothetical protein